MFKNTAGQEWVVYAFEDEGGTNPGNPVAADQANITATVRIDGASANTVDDTNPTVLAEGYYTFGITAAESNGDSIVIIPVSATANVIVIGVPGAVYTRTDTSGIEAKVDLAQLDLDIITGTAGALIDDGTGAGQIALTSGAIDTVTTTVTATNVTTVNGLGADVLTEAAIADNAFANEHFANGALTSVEITSVAGAAVTSIDAATLTAIEDEVWDSLQSAHVIADSMGILATEIAALQTDLDTLTAGVTLAAGAITAAATAADHIDLIWDELMAAHTTADTSGLLMNEWQDGGRLDLILDIIAADVVNVDGIAPAAVGANMGTVSSVTGNVDGNVTGSVGSNLELGPTEVLAQVNAALDTVIPELGVGAPAVTPTMRTAIILLYMALRCKLDVQTSGTDSLQIHKDDDVLICEKLITDAGGDYSEAKMISG